MELTNIKEDNIGFYLKLIDLDNDKIILYNKLFDTYESACNEAEKIRSKDKIAVNVYEVYKSSRRRRFYPALTSSYEEYNLLNNS